MKKIESIIRVRLSGSDGHYGGNLVDGARIIQLFGDVGTELLIRLDGDEGLLKAYTWIEMKDSLYSGDYVEVYGEITEIGNTSRKMKFEARKVISARPDINDSACEFLDEPVLICLAEAIAVTPKDKQRLNIGK